MVLVGIELIFFVDDCMMLRLRFLMKIVVITPMVRTPTAIAKQLFNTVKDFSAPHTAMPERRLGVHKELGGDMARTADPN